VDAKRSEPGATDRRLPDALAPLAESDCAAFRTREHERERDEWELPGGQLEEGETPEECVVREIEEELSLAATVEELLDVYVYEVLPGANVLIVTFGCSASQPPELHYSDEHDGVTLATLDELDGFGLPEGYRASIRSWKRHLIESNASVVASPGAALPESGVPNGA
jgi:mutator protein MutT